MAIEARTHKSSMSQNEYDASLVTETHERDIGFSCNLFGSGSLNIPYRATRTKGIKLTAALFPFLCPAILEDPDMICQIGGAADTQALAQVWIQVCLYNSYYTGPVAVLTR